MGTGQNQIPDSARSAERDIAVSLDSQVSSCTIVHDIHGYHECYGKWYKHYMLFILFCVMLRIYSGRVGQLCLQLVIEFRVEGKL